MIGGIGSDSKIRRFEYPSARSVPFETVTGHGSVRTPIECQIERQ